MNFKTVWEYSLETEAKRLLHCAHQMTVGFYRVNNFKVLPFPIEKKNALAVSFPDLNYISIPRFWENVRKININNFPIQAKSDLVIQTIDLLKKANLPAPQFQNTEILWGKACKEILNTIYQIIPSKKGLVKEIIIYPTSFGTSSSFNVFKRESNDKIIIYLREDQGIATIAEAILTSLIRADIYEKLDGVWQESEIITDWLISESYLNKVLAKYERKSSFIPTIKGIRTKQQARLEQKSENFYRKLGLPAEKGIFSLNGLIPEIDKKPVSNFTETEKIALMLLVQKANKLVTFDDLADIFCKNKDGFSLWAISKGIQRLRDKLEVNGVSGSYIQTMRGQGYLLKN